MATRRTIRTAAAHLEASAGQGGTIGLKTNGAADPGAAPGGDRILTSREARAFLRIGRTKLHELTRAQRIPAYRIGDGRTSSLRYRMSDLLAWLVGRRV